MKLRRGFLWISCFLLIFSLSFSSGVAGEEQSFAGFGYFIDKLQFPTKKIGLVWATPLSVYEGPFFTNDQLHICLPPHYFEESHSPFFRGSVSTAGSSIDYCNNYGALDAAGHMNQKYFEMVFASEVKTGVPKITLPADPAEKVKEAALGSSPPPRGGRFQVFLPHDAGRQLTGGIFVNGSLSALTFDKPMNQNFRMTFQQGKKSTVVEVDGDHNVTLVSSPDEKPMTYQGTPNGAIYVNGNIGTAAGTGMSGKVKGRWTVGTPGDAFITDSLVYSDTASGSQPNGKDCLALITRSAFITRDAPDLLFLYATIFAAKQEGKEKIGTLFVLPNQDVSHHGELIWWGNYIGEYPAIMGTFDRATGESRDGYALHKFYDARLAANPPPFFPVVGGQEMQTPPVSKNK